MLINDQYRLCRHSSCSQLSPQMSSKCGQLLYIFYKTLFKHAISLCHIITHRYTHALKKQYRTHIKDNILNN